MTAPDVGATITAVISMLEAATGRPVGDHQAPGRDDRPPSLPYAVVEHVPGGTTAGSAATSIDTIGVVVQVTSVGERRDQASALAHRVLVAMTARDEAGWKWPLTVENLHGETAARVLDRRHETAGGVDREGPLFNAIDLYLVTVSSAGI